MAFELVIGTDAYRDIEEIMDWYSENAPGILGKFADAFYSSLDRIVLAPESLSPINEKPEFRKTNMKRFPYYVIFRLDTVRNQIVVMAVVHEKRDRRNWLKRLK